MTHNPMTMVERVARAMIRDQFSHEGRTAELVEALVDDAWSLASQRDRAIASARAAIAAMKYEDGTDEGDFVDAAAAEKIDPVALICAHDRMIDQALSEGK